MACADCHRADDGDVDGFDHYGVYIASVVTPRDRFAGLRLVLDCANGSASSVAPDVFRQYGADVTVIGNAPFQGR